MFAVCMLSEMSRVCLEKNSKKNIRSNEWMNERVERIQRNWIIVLLKSIMMDAFAQQKLIELNEWLTDWLTDWRISSICLNCTQQRSK